MRPAASFKGLSQDSLFWYNEILKSVTLYRIYERRKQNAKIINQLLVVAIGVISIVSMCFQCVVFIGDFASILEATSWHLGLAALVFMIAAYESRFNAYKIKRETIM